MCTAELWMSVNGIHAELHGDSSNTPLANAVDLAYKNGATHHFKATDPDAEPVWILVNDTGLTVGFINVFQDA